MKKTATPAVPGKNTNPDSRKIRNRLLAALPLFRRQYTYISGGIMLKGDLIAEENIVLDGKMFGNIRSSKHVSLGPESRFEGNIESRSAVLSGYVKGRVNARETLVVRVPATIIGDLISASVQVESGVVLQGKIFSSPQQDGPAEGIVRDEILAKLAEPVESR